MKLRNWDFLPIWLHSLEPYDRFIQRTTCMSRFADETASDSEFVEVVHDFDSGKVLLNESKLYKIKKLDDNEFIHKIAYNYK